MHLSPAVQALEIWGRHRRYQPLINKSCSNSMCVQSPARVTSQREELAHQEKRVIYLKSSPPPFLFPAQSHDINSSQTDSDFSPWHWEILPWIAHNTLPTTLHISKIMQKLCSLHFLHRSGSRERQLIRSSAKKDTPEMFPLLTGCTFWWNWWFCECDLHQFQS